MFINISKFLKLPTPDSRTPVFRVFNFPEIRNKFLYLYNIYIIYNIILNSLSFKNAHFGSSGVGSPGVSTRYGLESTCPQRGAMLEILIDCDLKFLPSFVLHLRVTRLSVRTFHAHEAQHTLMRIPAGFLTKAKSAPSAEFLRLLERLSPLTAENFSALSALSLSVLRCL